MIKFDIEKLEEIIENLYKLCHVKVCIFDENMNEILFYPKKYTPLCALVRKTDQGVEKCKKADIARFEEVRRIKQTKMYICPYGLTEVFAPIIINGRVVGFMNLGQILTETTKVEDLINCVSFLNLREEEVLEAVNSMEVISNDHLKASVFILSVCMKYIYEEKSINIINDDLADKIKNYIDEHLFESISVNDLCQKFFISRVSLYNLFEKYYSLSVAEYIRIKKLEKSKNLIEQNPSMSIEEVCDKVNIDYNYFSKMFKKRYGITPKKYKKISFSKGIQI